MDRVILHCDMNSFFASVELLEHPELKDRPVAVCGDPESRHGIILAKNEPAKQPEVKNKPQQDAEEAPAAKQEHAKEPKQDFLVAPQPKKPAAPKPKAKPKEKFVPVQKKRPEPKPQRKSKTDKAPELANPLKSLLASVDDLEKTLGEENNRRNCRTSPRLLESGSGGARYSGYGY